MTSKTTNNFSREAHGVELICKVLPITPSTYFDHVAKRVDPEKLSFRAKRDAALRPEINRVLERNLKVYGARKVWLQIKRERELCRRAMHGGKADAHYGPSRCHSG